MRIRTWDTGQRTVAKSFASHVPLLRYILTLATSFQSAASCSALLRRRCSGRRLLPGLASSSPSGLESGFSQESSCIAWPGDGFLATEVSRCAERRSLLGDDACEAGERHVPYQNAAGRAVIGPCAIPAVGWYDYSIPYPWSTPHRAPARHHHSLQHRRLAKCRRPAAAPSRRSRGSSLSQWPHMGLTWPNTSDSS